MRDQIAAPFRAGLRAATINSTNVDEWSSVLDHLRSGRLDAGALVGELAAAGRPGGHAVAAVPAPGRLPRRAGGPGRPAATGRRLGVSGPPPTAEAASAVRARDLLARTGVRDGVSFDGRCCWWMTRYGRGGRSRLRRRCWQSRREPGDAARGPPAPLSAIRGVGERCIRRGRRARPRRAGLRTFCETPVASSGSAACCSWRFHVVRSSSWVTRPAAMVKPGLRRPQEGRRTVCFGNHL
jgi:hypothetical protein